MKGNIIATELLLGALAVLTACSSSGADAGKGKIQAEQVTDTVAVSVIRLEKKVFSRHLVCNGKLEAVRRADIRFVSNGTVTAVNVAVGDAVRAGQVLGRMDRTDAEMRLKSAGLACDRALASLEDRLLDYGLTIADTASLSAERKRSIFMSTGYADALLAVESAERDCNNCTLTAPFAGKVANLQARQYEQAGSFCTLVDDSRFIVLFNILETEYPLVKAGMKTVVTPLSNDISVSGRVRTVSPSVGVNGQIPVTAEIQGHSGLIEGMNVKIVVESEIGNRFVVPRKAVVVRDGQNVVFTCRDGKSQWVYVKILDSNSSEHCIEADTGRDAHLSEGEIVIVDGNESLADGTPIKII